MFRDVMGDVVVMLRVPIGHGVLGGNRLVVFVHRQSK
jgi:hypothetical protein